MKELEEKILDILLRCEVESSLSHAAKEIASLYNKELAFEIACNPDVMEAETNYKMYQEQIVNYKKLIEAYEELDKCLSIKTESVDEIVKKHSQHFSIRLKIDELKEQLK
jgi:hypothetical protein